MDSNIKKKVVLVDIHSLYRAETGIKKYIELLIELSQEESTEAYEYTFYPKLSKVIRSLNSKRKSHILSRLFTHFDIFLWKQVVIPIKAHLIKADIVFYPDFYSSFWRLRAKKVVMFHDTFFWDTPEDYGRLWGAYFRWICIAGLKRGGAVITISKYAKMKIQHVLPFPIGIQVITHPYRNIAKLRSEASLTLSQLGLKKTAFFLHVGVFEKRKNLTVLVKAFKKFLDTTDEKDTKLVLVGRQPKSAHFDDFQNVDKLIRDYGITKNVIRPGYLSDSEIANLYASATAYVFPSSNEGFGIPILEAFEMNCPIIISNQSALTEIAGNAALQFEIGNHDELCTKMMLVGTNRTVRENLIKCGKERLKEFNRETYMIRLEKLFNRILEKKLEAHV